MTALLVQFLPWIIGVLATGAGLFGLYARGRADGKAKAVANQREADARARDIADEVENDVGVLTAGRQREELKRWSAR